MKNLIIVESPTKAKTISRFLGNDYTIKFSMGHIMDLPKSKLGIDLNNNFSPQYEIITDKKKIISDLTSSAKDASEIILATDPDREGEAIASNIRDILTGTTASNAANASTSGTRRSMVKQIKGEFKRIVFHEITENAIKEALENPRDVDKNLVDAQIARRVLDRLVGYQLSPVLWKKVRRGLSAGRVQSVALRFIAEREREIEKFAKNNYWTIHALFKKKGKEDSIEFELVEINREKLTLQEKFQLYDGEYTVTKTTIDTEEKAQEIVNDLDHFNFLVADVLQRQVKRSPYAPFTTSTLQQESSRRYGYSGKRTMSLAQKLYEEGYITYHRTDSVTLSLAAIGQMRSYLEKEFGKNYITENPRVYSGKQKLAQEAHEGIRPTKVHIRATDIEQDLGRDYARLYDLIWVRTLASQMADAIIESTTIYVDSKDNSESNKQYRFKASGSVLVFEGFLKLNPQALKETRLPHYEANEAQDLKKTRVDQHETQPPPRYNDASLIAALEEKGIGRPSTYASIISTLVDRSYVERIEKRFVPTPIGIAVNDFLVKNFSNIDDVPFTAQMESELDEIANGKQEWETMMRNFYTPFEKRMGEVQNAERVKIATESTDEICPQCGGILVIRHGRFGKFLSCDNFPDCKFTKPFVEKTDLTCPKDGGKVIIKKTRKGRKFYGCSNYPTCDFAAWKLEDIKSGGYSSSAKRKNVTVRKKPSMRKTVPTTK